MMQRLILSITKTVDPGGTYLITLKLDLLDQALCVYTEINFEV